MMFSNNLKIFKEKIITFIIIIYILSFFFENYYKFQFQFLRFSIVEIIYIFLIFLTILIYRLEFIKFIFRLDKKNIFELIIFSVLILKTIKYIINLQNYYNLYELIIWMYMISIYLTFKFYLLKNKNLIYWLENSFIAVSLIISLHVIYSFIIYKLGYESSTLWAIRDKTYYPYFGTTLINFKSLLFNSNHAAYLLAPGLMLLFLRFKNNLILAMLFIFFLIVFYLIKSKFLINFFSILIIYTVLKNLNLNNIKLNKFLLLTSIISLSIFYFFITHFIIIEKEILDLSNFELFKQYYYTDFSISLNNHDIYGSLFLKLKFTAIEIAKSFNYIFFNSNNFYNHEIVLKNFDFNHDPHSDYFSALANYGILGFSLLIILPIYIIIDYIKHFDQKEFEKISFLYFLIIVRFFIQSTVTDFLHYQFIWIIFSMYKFNRNFRKNNN